MTTNLPMVTAPWGREKDLSKASLARAYGTCQRRNRSSCIHTNLVRAFAEHQGRTIRYPRTYKGECHWSERIEDQWYMFVAPLNVPYVRMIDAFDNEDKHFRAPVECPMGPVRCLGLCEVRKDTAEVRKTRIAALRAQVASRPLKPRARQLPYVLGKVA